MARAFGFSIIDKANAAEMQLVAAAISQYTPIDYHTFIRRYSTTIYNRVYLSYYDKIGKGTVKSLFDQIRILTHETQHVADFKENPTKMVLYGIPSERTKIEAHAMANELYLYWCFYGKLPNLKEMTDKLYYYGLDETDRAVARKHLLVHAPIARRGAIPNDLVVRKAIRWLDKNCLISKS
jgi:hypothetical protein